MAEFLELKSNAIAVTLTTPKDGPVCIRAIEPVHLATTKNTLPNYKSPYFSDADLPLVQARLDCEGSLVYKTSKSLIGNAIGLRLRYKSHQETTEGTSRTLSVTQIDEDSKIEITSQITIYHDFPAIRFVGTLTNTGNHDIVVTQVSSFAIGGLTTTCQSWQKDYVLSTATNTWFREAQWVEQSFPSIGLDSFGIYNTVDTHRVTSLARYAVMNQGTFSTEGHLPMGILSRADKSKANDGWLWQIEHNGAWLWEIGEFKDSVYVAAGGPVASAGHEWRQSLKPGESFTTVPACICRVVDGGVDALFDAMTKYRRYIRRDHQDQKDLPIIFNDFMNCLMGDPTEDKIKALIQPAVSGGSKYYCIDAGWYADDNSWWDSVGEWEPSTTRFQSGFGALIQSIRDAGLIPGLWLEPEVVGIRSKVADQLPQEAFFCRGGKRIIERCRYHLDFRHPAVRGRLTGIVSGLIKDYNIGYFKFDYNIDLVGGTDVGASSSGAGMLDHNRAYLDWIGELLDTYPNLVIENCSSGGQRMEYASLSVHPLQSVTDQEDVVRLVAIAAAAPTAVTPEQGAIWLYPQPGWNNELVALGVVNTLLGRVHLSGRLDQLSRQQSDIIADGMKVYKTKLVDFLPSAVPFWPLGLPKWADEWLALGMWYSPLQDTGKAFVAVWRRGGTLEQCIPIPKFLGRNDVSCHVVFPKTFEGSVKWESSQGSIRVTLPEAVCARLVCLQ
ncbi:putative Melibiase subfamily, partial [Rhexocercosporidium sp. MPI-PUGE-AT-0058]